MCPLPTPRLCPSCANPAANAAFRAAAVLPSGFGAQCLKKFKRGGELNGCTDLKDAPLAGLDCSNCDLSGVDMSGATLSGANLQGARCIGANFMRSIMAGNSALVILAEIAWRARVISGKQASWLAAGVEAANADFTDAAMSTADLRSGDFKRSKFILTDLTYVHATDAVFDEAVLDGAILDYSDFSRSTFTKTSFFTVAGGQALAESHFGSSSRAYCVLVCRRSRSGRPTSSGTRRWPTLLAGDATSAAR